MESAVVPSDDSVEAPKTIVDKSNSFALDSESSAQQDEINTLIEQISTRIYTSPPSGIGSIPEDLECLVSMDDITEENYVEYFCYPSLQWKSSKISQPIIEHLLQTQFNDYISKVQKSDCQAELRRLITQGPPIYISDPYGLPLNDENDDDTTTETTDAALHQDVGTSILDPDPTTTASPDGITTRIAPKTGTSGKDACIIQLWYSSDQQLHSAKLHNAIDKNDERYTILWDELKSYLID